MNQVVDESTKPAGKQNHLEIEYCTRCRWLLRAAWLAQEILTTFESDIGRVSLVPGSGGIFEVRLMERLFFRARWRSVSPKPRRLSSCCAIVLRRKNL